MKVAKYIKNLGKSVAYTTADVLGKKFEYVSEFKSDNQEVFKETYHAIKDYRATFTRVKKAVEQSKIYSAAKVGYDSVLYSISTGDFYGKQRENEIINTYGGSLVNFEEFDIDNDDFDMGNEDISTGDKVLAVAIKKNSKIGTAMTVDAITETGKAQMATGKENTYLLYTQQERMLNKLDGGFNSIMNFLQQNGEQTAKVQNQMNDNLNKFMSSVDNNVTKLTKQMDELLEMQRNMYKPVTQDNNKKKIGYDDIISRNGVLNIKEYFNNVKKNTFNTINDQFGGSLSMLFGDAMGEGTNLLATMAATPFRSLMEFGINRALGAKFDKAASDLNKTLEGIIPSLIGKANALGKQEDAGIMGFLGKILGVKDKTNNSIDTSKYNKGPIPFDGVTKRAITDVIPYYLRKMTSVMTGEAEQVYDFNTGRWVSMSSVLQNHYNTVNAANISAENTLRGILEKGMGRSLKDAYADRDTYNRVSDAIKSLAAKLQANSGDFGTLKDLSSREEEVMKALKESMKITNAQGKDNRFVEYIDDNGKKKRVQVRENSSIGALSSILRQQRASQYSSIEQINNGDSILRHITAENLQGRAPKDYHGKSYVNSYGDFNDRAIQEMPFSQSLVRAKDEFGVTLYQYLRDMGSSLRFIKANSVNLNTLSVNTNGDERELVSRILAGSGNDVDYGASKSDKWLSKYYEEQHKKAEDKEKESFKSRVESAIAKAKEKGKTYVVADDDEFTSHDNKTGIKRLMTDNEAEINSKAVIKTKDEEAEAKEKRWKTISDIFGKDEANKMRAVSDKFDPNKSFKENMANAKDQGFSANLMMFSQILNSKIQNPVNAATDAVVKVDYWLQNLIYGEDLSESEKKKSLFDRMKDVFQNSMNKIKDAIDKGFDWVKEKMAPVFDPLKKLGEKLFGKPNDEGIYEDGLLSPFISGVQKGLRKNGQEVRDYMKRQAEEAKRKLKQVTDTNTESDHEVDYSDYIPTPRYTRTQLRNMRRSEIMNGINSVITGDDSIASNLAMDRLARIQAYNINKNRTDVYSTDAERASRRERLIEQVTNELHNQEAELEALQNQYDEYNTAGWDPNNTANQGYYRSIAREVANQITEARANVDATRRRLANIEGSVTRIKRMAVGGVNRTGKAFRSILSPGEIHNGNVVPRMGIYNIEPGDTVINPAPTSVRSLQAKAEKSYLNKIRTNAETNDGLTPINNISNDFRTALFDKLDTIIDMNRSTMSDESMTLKERLQETLTDPERLANALENPLATALATIIGAAVPKVSRSINEKVLPWIKSKIKKNDDSEIGYPGEDEDSRVINSNEQVPDVMVMTGRFSNNPKVSNIATNAEADDKLSPITNGEEKAEERRNIQLLSDTDWRSLTDDKQRAEFLGNVASRGIIGGGLGLLVGGPLLGAAVGAASSLTKSTNAFANMLFGEAELDGNGNVQVDEKGNVIRKDTGLLSKELMSAIPDVKKFGIGGALGGLLLGNPLLGLFVGSGLGFAKNSEMFQGTLFGEGSIFSKENVNKFKKALPNVGIGAAAGALFIPGGPFGIIGGALLGATGGYVTATDRFKDAILGEKEDPNDPDSKRVGGVVGAIKDELKPLKDFGLHLRDSIMDEIFGKDTGNGREGGIFGAIKDNMVKPLIDGSRSVFDELWNKTSDMAHLLGDTYRSLKAKFAGNSFFGELIEGTDNLVNKVIHGAGNVAKFATKPFRLLGDDGIGGRLRSKRIRNGQEYTLTARERMMFRGQHGMAADDDFSASDAAIAGMSRDDLEYARSLLGYNENENYFNNRRDNAYKTFGQELRKNISRKDAKKIVTLIKDGNYAGAEKFARTLKVDDSVKVELQNLISAQKSKLNGIDTAMQNIKATGGNVQDILSDMGLNVDVTDKRSMRYLEKQLKREIAHTESGLTDEEREWEKQRDFWTNSKSPLTTVNNATSNIQKILENIYHNLSYGNEYDRASDEIKSTYSREGYINMKRNNAITGALQSRNMDDIFSSSVSKIGTLDGKNMVVTSAVMNHITEDYLPLFTGNLKEFTSPNDVLHRLNIKEEITEMIEKACQIFDGMVLEQLVNKDAIAADYNEAVHKIAKAKNISVDYAALDVKELTRSPLVVTMGDNTYNIQSFTYDVSDGAKVTPKLTSQEQSDYDIIKQTFVDDYIKAHTPKSITTRYMSMRDMFKTTIRISRFFTPTKLPAPLKEFILLHPKEFLKATGKLARKAVFNIGRVFGVHEIDDKSTIQRVLNREWEKEADKEWKKEVDAYDIAYNSIPYLTDEQRPAAFEKLKYLDNIAKMTADISADIFGLLSEEDREKVHKTFVGMYIQARKDKQIFGRGLLGGVKKVATNVVDKIKTLGRNTMKLGNVLFNANGNAMDAKNRFMDKKRKQAKDIWDRMLVSGKGSEDYDKYLLPILAKYYNGQDFNELDENAQAKLKHMFVEAWADDAYSKLLYSGVTISERVRAKAQGLLYNAGNAIANKISDMKDRIKTNQIRNAAYGLYDRLNSDVGYRARLDVIAKSISGGNLDFGQLSDEAKETAIIQVYEQYKEEGGLVGEVVRKINSRMTRTRDKVMGTLKSGINNATDGGIDKVRAWKEKEQEQDTLVGKIFDMLDRRAMKKEREKIEGKKDSRLAKIIKWLFVGGVAAPIMVGFVKETLLPAIHDKIQPWLKKAGEKLIGVKDEVTGEYKGGLVSGIVNPIKKFFKDKFQNVHDWFANEGKYQDPNKGMSGLINNIKGVGEYIIGLWKSGAATIYGEWLPKALESFGRNIIPGLGHVLKGLAQGIGDMFKGKKDDLSGTDFSTASGKDGYPISTEGVVVQLNNGFGKKITLQAPPAKSNYKMNIDTKVSNVNKTVNDNGTATYTNQNTDANISSQKVNSDDMYKVSSQNGMDVYVKNGTNKKYFKDETTGTYVPITDYQLTMNDKLSDNSAVKHYGELEDSNALQAGYASRDNKILKTGAKALFTYNNMAIVGGDKFLKATTNIARESSSAVKALGVGGKIVGTASNVSTLGFKGASKLTRGAQKLGYGAVEYGGNALSQGLAKISGKLSSVIKSILSNNAVKKLLPDSLSKNIGKLADGIENIFVKIAKNSADDITARAGNLGGKVASKAVPIISMVTSFLLGWDNCRNILGTVNPNPSKTQRLCAAIINTLPDAVFTAGTAIGAASFGAAGVLSAVCYALGLAGVVILSVDSFRDAFVGALIDLFDSLGMNMEEIKKERQEAKEALEAYNEKNGTSLNISEYNRIIGNATNMDKLSSGARNAWSATFGYDSATKGDILSNTESVKSDNKKVEKVRKKLATIFSSIWQYYGEDDFNYNKAVDKDGNDLKGKSKLNANQITFENAATKVIEKLVQMLGQCDQAIIDKVAGNVSDFVGPIDASVHLKKVYKKGKADPTTQFNIDDEHADWKRIKAIAGICAIINEIFKPLGNKKAVTAIVVSELVSVYFNSSESEVLEWSENLVDNSMYTLDMTKYDSKLGKPTTGNTMVDNAIATNANTNDKLSPIGNIFDKLYSNGNMLSNTIDMSLISITGGFENIGKVFESLRLKNAEINKKIDSLKLSPTDQEFWKIEVDESNPFASAMYKFTESISRVIKAPFVLASSINAYAATASLLATNGILMDTNTIKTNGSSTTSSSQITQGVNSTIQTSTNNTKNSLLGTAVTGLKNTLSKIGSGLKSLFGKGKGDTDPSDPYHIYQRDFNDSYNISGDAERQTVADSGCGPASAASILRMYGKEGSMNNAVNFALHNKYKEKDGGTYPEYFQDYLGSNGISTNPNATNADVVSSLAQGKPVILMGQNTDGAKSSPYGNKYSHYVVARGLDKNGNVIVEDSEDKQGNTRYSLADTLRNTTVRITTGKGKYGRANSTGSEASGLINLLGSYVSNVSKGVFGNFYDALSNPVATTTNNNTSETTGSVNGSIADSQDANTNMKRMYNYMKSQGLSDNLTAAILGNVYTESWTTFSPTILEGSKDRRGHITDDMDHGFGLIQWTHPESRAALYNWCTGNGCDPETLDGQTKWIVAQIKGINISSATNPANARMFNGQTGAGTMSYNWNLIKSRGTFEAINSYSIERAVRLWLECVERPWSVDAEVGPRSENAKRILAICKGSGSGRGVNGHKSKNIINNLVKPKTTNNNRIPIYGKANEETVSSNNDTMQLISNLGNYTKSAIKGVYGKFYDAVYGNEQQQTDNENKQVVVGSDGGNIVSGVIPYDTYRHWKQGDYGTYPAPWASKSIATGGYASCASVGCAVVSAAILLAHSRSVSDASFDPGKFIDDVVARGATSSGGGYYTLGGLINYKNEGVMTEAVDYDNVTYKAFGSNDTWQGHSSWDYIYNTLLNELNNGNYVMIKVTIRHTCMHWVALDYIDTSAKEIYIMDPGSTKEKLSEYGASKVIGYCSFKCSKSSAKQYVLNGKRAGTGKGKSSSDMVSNNFNISNATKKRMKEDIITEAPSGRGMTGLKSADSLVTTRSIGRGNSTTSIQKSGSNYTSTGRATNTNIDLNQLIAILGAIAQNADKMDAVVQLLGAIATNTKDTSNAVTSNNKSTPPNGLAALRSALDSNGSGLDIANAVYQIARS